MLKTLLSVIRAVLVELLDSVAAQGMCRDVTPQKNEIQEKLLSILLAAAAAFLCAAIDYLTKEEE